MNKPEHRVVAALREQAEPGEVILHSVRFTDVKGGDVEADILVLIPELGAAVIEVKGGKVENVDGQWTTTNRKGSSRRINPVEQARRGKHALRRFLDRQPEWDGGLLRSSWFVAMPQTTVTVDLGPEAPREHLIDRADLSTAMPRIRTVLANPLNRDPVPSGEWVDDAVSLLLRLPQKEPATPMPLVTWRSAIAALAGLLLSAVLVIGLGWWGLAAIGALAALTAAYYFRRRREDSQTSSTARYAATGAGVLLAAAGLGAVGGALAVVGWNLAAGSQQCAPGYEPCLPVRDDLDCSQINGPVRITGTDQYDLDRNGDGIGCETPDTTP